MDNRLQRLLDFAEKDLHENLMPWWSSHIMDGAGGFYGRVTPDGISDPEADRYIVLSSRLVWTYSAAYRVTGREEYKRHAEDCYRQFTETFYDKEYGGFYFAVDKGGKPSKPHKFVYGNAFAVYALAEYARAFGSQEAVELALKTAEKLDSSAWDTTYGGYFETATREWAWTPTVRGMNAGKEDQKTMNTHLHMIEAYTNLLRVADTPALRSRTRVLLYLFLETITNRVTHHFHYFQRRDWTPTTPEQSYGHDIEGSWLLTEAAEVLGEAQGEKDVANICVNIARAVLDDGFSELGGLYTDYDPRTGKYHPGFTWWEQSEAVVGFLNAWQMTGEEKFLDKAVAVTDFIDKYFVDRELGGWYAHLNGDLTPRAEVDKAMSSICPYHNARMHLELIERIGKMSDRKANAD